MESDQHIPTMEVHFSTLKVICFINMWLHPFITLYSVSLFGGQHKPDSAAQQGYYPQNREVAAMLNGDMTFSFVFVPNTQLITESLISGALLESML